MKRPSRNVPAVLFKRRSGSKAYVALLNKKAADLLDNGGRRFVAVTQDADGHVCITPVRVPENTTRVVEILGGFGAKKKSGRMARVSTGSVNTEGYGDGHYPVIVENGRLVVGLNPL